MMINQHTDNQDRRKTNLYGRLLVVFILMFATHILSSESSFLLGNELDGPRYGGMVVAVLYFVMLVYFIRILTILNIRELVIQLRWGYAFIALIVIAVISNPFLDLFEDSTKMYIFSYCGLAHDGQAGGDDYIHFRRNTDRGVSKSH